MAVGGMHSANGWMEMRLSDKDRRLLLRMTVALEKLAKSQQSVHIREQDIYRDAETGEFTTAEHANENPATTVKEIDNG